MKGTFQQSIQSLLPCEAILAAFQKARSIEHALPTGAMLFLARDLSRTEAVVLFARTDSEAERFCENLRAIGAETLLFPDIDVLPFAHVRPASERLIERMRALHALATRTAGFIVVCSLDTAFRRFPPFRAFASSCVELSVGKSPSLSALLDILSQYGYRREYKVSEPGVFAVRGDILDVFPIQSAHPVRLSFFDADLENIKTFAVDTQTSREERDQVRILPSSEFALDKDQGLSESLADRAIHSSFGDYYQETGTFFDYVSEGAMLIFVAGFWEAAEAYLAKIARVCPETHAMHQLYCSFQETQSFLGRKQAFRALWTQEPKPSYPLRATSHGQASFSEFQLQTERILSEDPLARIFLAVEYVELAHRLMHIMRHLSPVLVMDGEAALDDAEGRLYITCLGFEYGFQGVDPGGTKVYLFTEQDVSGKKRLFRKRLSQIAEAAPSAQAMVIGEYVVHLSYGIAIFRGVERLTVLGKEKDYIRLEYANQEKLFVPLEQSNLIGPYIGAANAHPKLDSIGSRSWQKKRASVQKSIEEFAQKLVRIYAKRKHYQGFAFAKDTDFQRDFEDAFPYVDTPDQVKVLEEIKQDMEKPEVMDRLLCGDVGFGKTEMALRAAFKAIMSGRQVALLAPTTVLVEQHLMTIQRRMKGFAVRADMLTRFRSDQDARRIVRALETHDLDLVVGTHRLFGKDVKFHKLGLVIMDEEHKFGVEHKEALKAAYPQVDFLSLSATPIPRTLSMSLAGIRDISYLQTPPDMRTPIETIVAEMTPDVLSYAIQEELLRGGQVFVVHNNIKRLPEMRRFVQELAPNAMISVGHGQMHEEELEEAFLGFMRGKYHIFVCTTIIESGLDIPNANTIIVTDAQNMGLSQLYQLKGRVGRSDKQAYAYFLYPSWKSMNETAQKRLHTIGEYTDLGAGFQIAMQDLEIRGAGNILGPEQHGNIVAVGYDIYTRLLREEVDKIKGQAPPSSEPVIDLSYDAFIPESWITDPSTKMECYIRILASKNETEMQALSDELSDRFGPIPEVVYTLFAIARLKAVCGSLGVQSLIEKGGAIDIQFTQGAKVDPKKVFLELQSQNHPIRMNPSQRDRILYQAFEAGVDMKVKRMIQFLEAIRLETV